MCICDISKLLRRYSPRFRNSHNCSTEFRLQRTFFFLRNFLSGVRNFLSGVKKPWAGWKELFSPRSQPGWKDLHVRPKSYVVKNEFSSRRYKKCKTLISCPCSMVLQSNCLSSVRLGFTPYAELSLLLLLAGHRIASHRIRSLSPSIVATHHSPPSPAQPSPVQYFVGPQDGL
jgi:hypothetical protein